MVSRGEQKNKNGHLRRGCKGWPAARGSEDRCLRGTTGGRRDGRSGSKALTNPSSIIATGSSLLGLILHTPDQLVLLLEASIFIRNGENIWHVLVVLHHPNQQPSSLPLHLALWAPLAPSSTAQSWQGHCPVLAGPLSLASDSRPPSLHTHPSPVTAMWRLQPFLCMSVDSQTLPPG